MPYPLKEFLIQGEVFELVKGPSDLSKYAGSWIVLESNIPTMSRGYEVVVAYVAKEPSFRSGRGRSREGYELYLIRSGIEGVCFCSALELDDTVCREGVWQECFLRFRALQTSERARISHYLDEHAEHNAQQPDSECFRLVSYSNPRRITSSAVFGFEKVQ